MSAGRSVLSDWQTAGVIFRFMRLRKDSAYGSIPAQSGRVTISLTVSPLSALAVRDVFVQLAFMVTDGVVLATNIGFLDVSGEGHNNSRIRFLFPAVRWCKPSRGLRLY